MAAVGMGLGLLIYRKVTQVLWGANRSEPTPLVFRLMSPSESVLVLPPYGIQLETHRGLPSLPFFVSRRFIPLTEVHDVLINEGLRRWDVRYYLAVLYSPRQGEQRLDVAYEVRMRLVHIPAPNLLIVFPEYATPVSGSKYGISWHP